MSKMPLKVMEPRQCIDDLFYMALAIEKSVRRNRNKTQNLRIVLNIVATCEQSLSALAIGLVCGWWMLMGSVV